ncbi:MAG TPA: ATP-binding protein, partial [Woeseiaceae bacterium]|nr:ATP-binding protein [Woeseiaceae bacterium]
RRHRLHVRLPSEPMFMDGDPVRLTQVFGNLLTNAAKYTEPGGRIELAAEIDSGPSRSVTVRVRDTGAGIPEEMLDRVFDLFTQADGKHNRTQTGLGIGLALVRALTELHGGSVRAKSKGSGQGSEFVVRLPLLERHVKRAGDTASVVAQAPQGGLRILIVDDNEDLANGLGIYLSAKSGHDVHIAHTGERGIEAACDFRPDVVLLDIGLPDIDGYEVARRMRAEGLLDDVPLIGISGFSTAADKRRAVSAGFDRYFVKPIAFDELNDVLAQPLAAEAGRAAG